MVGKRIGKFLLAGGALVCGMTISACAAANIPASCLTMNLTPYSTPEKLQIISAKSSVHFNVEIADSFAERQQGLMCRTNLDDTYGMLFEFPDNADRAFWMKNTVSALDIIYIASDGRIVSIQKNAKPLDITPLPSYGPATGVLEINAGLSDKLGLKPGDVIQHPFFHKP